MIWRGGFLFFLERIYQRKHGIPWRVIETERTYLREMTVEDVDALYEIYAQEGMTDFIEPLCEKRRMRSPIRRHILKICMSITAMECG